VIIRFYYGATYKYLSYVDILQEGWIIIW
jgi:hypothetical protein